MKCYKMYVKELPFEDKADLFSPLCSKYQWEYACNNIQRITLSASRCITRCIRGFWLSFFVFFFPDVYWSDNVFCTWGWILTLTCFRFLSQILSLCDVNHVHVGWSAVFKGFHVPTVRFRVYVSPPHLIWVPRLGTLFHCWSILNG